MIANLMFILLMLQVSVEAQVWFSAGNSLNAIVDSLVMNGSQVIVGGGFSSPYSYITQWNGATFSPLGTSGGRCSEMTCSSQCSTLFALCGGSIMQYNGSWTMIEPNSPNLYINAMRYRNNKLYVAGRFLTIGGQSIEHIASWDSQTWSSVGTGGPWNNSVAVFGMNDIIFSTSGSFYVGGIFYRIGGPSTPVNCYSIARFNGATWFVLGNSTVNGVICPGCSSYPAAEALATSGSLIYVAGQFNQAGSVSVNNIAVWNENLQEWFALGNGINGEVTTLTILGSYLVAGGVFTNAGTTSANNIASWDSYQWRAVGLGTDSTVYALAANGITDLYVGGIFTSAGGNASSRLAKVVFPAPTPLPTPQPTPQPTPPTPVPSLTQSAVVAQTSSSSGVDSTILAAVLSTIAAIVVAICGFVSAYFLYWRKRKDTLADRAEDKKQKEGEVSNVHVTIEKS